MNNYERLEGMVAATFPFLRPCGAAPVAYKAVSRALTETGFSAEIPLSWFRV